MTIRLVIADDHAVIRWGVKSLLENSEIEVVGEATTGEEAVAKAKKLKADVVLLDVRMPGTDGFWALERLQEERPETRVVMFSNYDNPKDTAHAVALGAMAYVLKGDAPEVLTRAILHAAAAPPRPRSVGERVRTRRRAADNKEVPLTARELDVLRHVAFGLSNREISSVLGIGIETVKEHVGHILRKLDVRDRTQAAIWATKGGLT